MQTHAKLIMARTVICIKHSLEKTSLYFSINMERIAGVERRRLGQLPAIPEGIALVSV